MYQLFKMNNLQLFYVLFFYCLFVIELMGGLISFMVYPVNRIKNLFSENNYLNYSAPHFTFQPQIKFHSVFYRTSLLRACLE